ncbi:MAG: arginine--tRNA ligase [Porphyromonas sp.]|nr:arginine--tRNA ligase [Porphyromonas sp.]
MTKINDILITKIGDAVEHLYGIRPAENQLQLQKTRREFKGHLTLVTFPLLKLSRKNPQQTAEEIGGYLLSNSSGIVKETEVINGFLNLTIASDLWIDLLRDLLSTEEYGHIKASEHSPLVMIEYSSPNTNKPLHLGHVRNNLLGYSLARILSAAGNRVVKTNIVNDRGIHICKSMLAWKKWGEGRTPTSAGIKGDHLVGDFYVLFDKHYKAELAKLVSQGKSKEQAEAESPLMQEAREMLRRWEAADPQVRELWQEMNSWVYAGFDETYKRLGVDFDKIYYESDTYLQGKSEVLRGLEAKLFVKDPDGSVWADLTKEGLDRKILLRADGTSVYMTQDIGTAKMRFADYPIDKMVYVVGNEQDYHFKVLSILLDKLGFAFGKGLVHFSYGMVELPEGKMKSREGTVVDADDLMDEMIAAAATIAREMGKGAEMSDEEAAEVARKVGLGALKYFILKVDPRKNMTFNPKESIDFNGNTASFIQYAYARVRSLMTKAGEQGIHSSLEEHTKIALSVKEESLIQMLSEYPEVLAEAAKSYSPAVIANYCYDLVKEYNQFYHDSPILKETDTELRSMRLELSKAFAIILKQAMALLGIEMPERM